MLNQLKNSFQDFSERIKSPYWGSFVLIWLYLNWKIPYSLIYIDHSLSLALQFDAIQNIIEQQGVKKILWFPALLTLLSLIFYYVASSTGLFIKELYLSWVKPFVLKASTRGVKIVSIDRYERLKRDTFKAKQQAEENRKQYLGAHADNEDLKNEVIEKETTLKQQDDELSKAKTQIIEHQKNIDQYLDRIRQNQTQFEVIGFKNINISSVFSNGKWRVEIESQLVGFLFEESYEVMIHSDNTYSKVQNCVSFYDGRLVAFYRSEWVKTGVNVSSMTEKEKLNLLFKVSDNEYTGFENGLAIKYYKEADLPHATIKKL